MKILSLDLGEFKSVVCFCQAALRHDAHAEFQTVVTDREVFSELIVEATYYRYAKQPSASSSFPAGFVGRLG